MITEKEHLHSKSKPIREQLSDLSVEERNLMLKTFTSDSEIFYQKALKAGTELVPGKGKGLEPHYDKDGKDLWCPCHRRNPCPIILQLERLVG
jgi:hypothetical protein